MGTQRTSMKDVKLAIEAQTDAINALVGALAGQAQTPVAGTIDTTPVTDPTPAPVTDAPRFEAGYMAHMKAKVAELVKGDGQARVLYARRNLKGENKLAFCLKARWAGLRDNGKLGAIEVYES